MLLISLITLPSNSMCASVHLDVVLSVGVPISPTLFQPAPPSGKVMERPGAWAYCFPARPTFWDVMEGHRAWTHCFPVAPTTRNVMEGAECALTAFQLVHLLGCNGRLQSTNLFSSSWSTLQDAMEGHRAWSYCLPADSIIRDVMEGCKVCTHCLPASPPSGM